MIMDKAIATTEQPTRDVSIFQVGGDLGKALQVAKVMASSSMVPAQYQGEKGIPNVIVAMELSHRIGISPWMVMQNLHIIQGRPAWASPFLIAMIDQSGKFEPLRFEINGTGDGRGCIAWTKLRLTGERVEGPRVDISMAKAEGWYGRNGSKWKTMPEVMLRYRAAAFFARLYAYDLICGLQTADEVIDIDPIEVPPQKGASLTQELLGETAAPAVTVEEAGILQPEPEPEQPAAEAEPMPSKEQKSELWREYKDFIGNQAHAVNAAKLITEGRGSADWTAADLVNLRADLERRRAEKAEAETAPAPEEKGDWNFKDGDGDTDGDIPVPF
jgi:hypothetical protein